jgi:hypothetical protein
MSSARKNPLICRDTDRRQRGERRRVQRQHALPSALAVLDHKYSRVAHVDHRLAAQLGDLVAAEPLERGETQPRPHPRRRHPHRIPQVVGRDRPRDHARQAGPVNVGDRVVGPAPRLGEPREERGEQRQIRLAGPQRHIPMVDPRLDVARRHRQQVVLAAHGGE